MDAFADLREVTLVGDHPNIPDQNLRIENVFGVDRSFFFLTVPGGAEFDITQRQIKLRSGEEISGRALHTRWRAIKRVQATTPKGRRTFPSEASIDEVVSRAISVSWWWVGSIVVVVSTVAFLWPA